MLRLTWHLSQTNVINFRSQNKFAFKGKTSVVPMLNQELSQEDV
jgi:hypothetical protein